MESNLEELRRRYTAAPDNEELRSELIRALMRSGLESEARDLVRARFHCSIPWEDHRLTDRSSRKCRSCEKSVTFVSSAEELRKHAKNRDCIVAPEDLAEAYYQERCVNLAGQNQELNKGPSCLGSMPGVRGNLAELIHYPETLPSVAQQPCFVFMISKDQEGFSAEQRTVILLGLYPSHKNMLELLTESLGVKKIEQQFISEPEVVRLYEERGTLFPDERFRYDVGGFIGL
ncbi:MAG: hypothetical protein P1V97_34475 [Planctomycetota bacterium]|nr:hypothetical protein [Planctomycetota bacterium]